MVDYFLASAQLLHAATALSVEQLPPESDHCPLTPSLDLQAQNSADSEHTSQVPSAGSNVNLRQTRYKADKVDTYRKALCNLIRPVFGTVHLLVALLQPYSHVFQRLLLPPLVVLANAIV